MSDTDIDWDDYEDTGTFPGCECSKNCDCRRRHFQAEAQGIAVIPATKEAKPFRHGDVCEFKGEDRDWKGRHIIDEISVNDDPERWEYATSQGAWIPHEELELVEESSVSSRAELHQLKEDERSELME